jgi:hypothetical protein
MQQRKIVASAGQPAATVIKATTTGPAVEMIARTMQGASLPRAVGLHAESHPPVVELAKQRRRPGG